MRFKYLVIQYLLFSSLSVFVSQGISYGQQTTIFRPVGENGKNNITEESLLDLYFLKAISKIDSIRNTAGTARHFSYVFSSSLRSIKNQIHGKDFESATFIKKFITSFATYFLIPCEEYENGRLSSSSPWANYFGHSQLQSWQLMVAGVNSHINEDMWRSLVDNFEETEIRKHKKLFLSVQKSLVPTYLLFFDTLLASNSYMRFMYAFTRGMNLEFGKLVLQKWRKRQVRLAILFYHDQKKFRSLHARIQRKKQNNDELILRERK